MMTLLFSLLLLFPVCFFWPSFLVCLCFIIIEMIVLYKRESVQFGMYGSMMWDVISVALVFLSVWIVLLMVLASIKLMDKSSSFLFTLYILLFILVLTFSVSSIFQFYVFFEASLIPTFGLILGWGYQPERLQAGLHMLFYTISSSLPLLVMCVSLSELSGSSFFLLFDQLSSSHLWFVTSLAIFIAFSVKLPLYLVHLWLPKAHVEAPLAGSMVLAGVLLKLGGYGTIRLVSLMGEMLGLMSVMWITWSMVGGVMASVICAYQSDVKFIIAISSVAHMSFVMGGIVTLSSWGLNGAMCIMVGHGFCSSGLFYAASLKYERSNTRSIIANKSGVSMGPIMVLWWFVLCAGNMSFPPSLSILGEVFSITSLYSWANSLFIILVLLVFFSAVISLFLYSGVQHSSGMMMWVSHPLKMVELLVLVMHAMPLYGLLFCSNMFKVIV